MVYNQLIGDVFVAIGLKEGGFHSSDPSSLFEAFFGGGFGGGGGRRGPQRGEDVGYTLNGNDCIVLF